MSQVENEILSRVENLPSAASADENADFVINAMVAGIVAAAVIPAHVNWAFVMAGMGAGVMAIGRCYGVELSRQEAWKLIKQFFLAAGFTFMGLTIGAKLCSMLLASTGVGYFGAVAIDVAVSAPLAYAVGSCAKAYFRDDMHKKHSAEQNARLGEMLRQKFRQARSEKMHEQVG